MLFWSQNLRADKKEEKIDNQFLERKMKEKDPFSRAECVVIQGEKISVYSISNYLSHLVRKSDKSIADTWNMLNG